MKKVLLAALFLILLNGCNAEDDFSESESSIEEGSSSAVEVTAQGGNTEELLAEGFIPAAEQTERVDGERLMFTVNGVYSQGEIYSISASGIKCADQTATPALDTTLIKDELYGDFRLDLYKDGSLIDSLKINVPRDDRFLILESVKDDLSYGCEILSNHTEFGADEYPDIVQLDFYLSGEKEIPQYARYFTIFDDKLTELPICENGKLSPPKGTHLEMKEAGLMVQHLVVSTDSRYEILKYEYTFDVDDRCLDRQEVKFYGWEE